MEYQIVANSDALTLLERIHSESTTLIYFDPPCGVFDKCDIKQLQQLYLHATCHAKRILNDNGTLVWHALPECASDVRNCLDRVFGSESFAFEIILKRRHVARCSIPTNNHTSLFVYSKTGEFHYEAPTRQLSDATKLYSLNDDRGPFRLGDITTPLNRPALQFSWHDCTPPNGRSWRYSLSKLDELYAEDRIMVSELTPPREKIYLSERADDEIGSVWDDIDLPPTEKIKKYSNGQQSLALLTRIITMLTKENDLVIDPFCGSGTSLIAANQLGCRWLGADSSPRACENAIERLKAIAGLECKLISEEKVRDFPVQSSLTELIRALPKTSDSQQTDIHQLIIACESKTLEFKQTLSLDIRTNSKEKHIETSCLKTIAGFLNSNGGTLLVGVTDDNKPLGISAEISHLHKGSQDKFLLHFKNLVRENIGEEFYPLLDFHLVPVDGNPILRVDCKQSNSPCFIGDDFYVRTNPATDKLAGKKQFEYISRRFPNNRT